MATVARRARLSLLLEILDQAFDRRAWHGTPLWGSIRGVTWREALRRPRGRGTRHNIWELVLHTAYWKFVVRRRLERDPAIVFPREGADWPRLPARPDAAAWRKDVALLKHTHRALRAAIAALPDSRLGRRAWLSRWTNLASIYGIASHDLYHSGQIQLVKRLVRRG